MDAEEDRHALLFEPSCTPDSLCSKDAPMTCQPAPQASRLFPNKSPSPAVAKPQTFLGAERMEESGETLLHQDVAKPCHNQRRVTLFASIEVAAAQKRLTEQAVCSYPFASYEQSHQPLQLHEPQHTVHAPPLPLAGPADFGVPGATSSVACAQRVTCGEYGSRCLPSQQIHVPSGEQHEGVMALPPLPHSCSPGCICATASKGDDLANNLKSVGSRISNNGIRDVDARRFVAQELQEINRMIQARALRLKQQEEEAAASVAMARNSLRLHAQQLLNQAAEKLERVVTQHRRRAEAAVDEAAFLLRRALEARRMLQHERSLFKRLQEQHRQEEHLRLTATTEALEAERRRCVDLEGRLRAVQQANKQLRALLHAHSIPAHRGDKKTHLNATEPSSVFQERHQPPDHRSTVAYHTPRPCVSRVPSVAAPSLPPVARGAIVASSEPGRGKQRCTSLRTSGNVRLPSSCVSNAAPGQAIVDVQVRLPSFSPVVTPVPAPEAPKDQTRIDNGSKCAEDQQPPQLAQHESQQPGPPVPARLSSKVKSFQEPAAPLRRKHKSTDSDISCSDDSAPSRGSSISSSSHVEQVGRRNMRRRTSDRLSRSASHGSISTSTSSSSGAAQRQPRGHHGRTKGSVKCLRARHQRISFSVPELDRRKPRDTKGSSFCGSASPVRTVSSGHRPALRGDVAGRLQAFLTRLQEQQLLQGKIHSLADHLLNMQGRADAP